MRRRRWLVVDTNMLVSASLLEGTPGRLIERAGDKEPRLFTVAPFSLNSTRCCAERGSPNRLPPPA